MDEIEKRLSHPVDWQEQYWWAILSELRAIRQALVPEKPATEDVKLREGRAEKEG